MEGKKSLELLKPDVEAKAPRWGGGCRTKKSGGGEMFEGIGISFQKVLKIRSAFSEKGKSEADGKATYLNLRRT